MNNVMVGPGMVGGMSKQGEASSAINEAREGDRAPTRRRSLEGNCWVSSTLANGSFHVHWLDNFSVSLIKHLSFKSKCERP